MKQTIAPQTGSSFILKKGQYLKVIDVEGQQVSDMVIFNARDKLEKLSSGKTLDFEETINITASNFLWSNRSQKMMKIIQDTNGQNDFLLAPCSQETFEIMYNYKGDHPSCLKNLSQNLDDYNIIQDEIPNAFNIFMNVKVNSEGKISVNTPTSKAGDFIIFEALMDLIVALTACSAEDSNGGSFKPIQFEILENI